MANEAGKYSTVRRKPRPVTLLLIVGLHILAAYGLARAFAPDFTQGVERDILTTFDITQPPPSLPDIPPENEAVPDEGAQGDAGRKAVARPVTAPDIQIPLRKDKPAPKTASTGTQNSSGAKDRGDGTGAAGAGDGTGSGRAGSGAGGAPVPVIAQKPSVKSGNLNTASDFPIPPGGRESRFGKSVTVAFTVGTDGRAKNCSVARSAVDAQTTALVCELVVRKIRFNPAISRSGSAMEARYGYRVDFGSAT